MDGALIATTDLDTVTLGGNNIPFGHSDINANSSTDPNDAALLFTLIDNVIVVRPGDIDRNNMVNVLDLLDLLAA